MEKPDNPLAVLEALFKAKKKLHVEKGVFVDFRELEDSKSDEKSSGTEPGIAA